MSLKKIAARAGTSVSTVSRVLNGNVKNCRQKELAQQILQIAEEMNYHPNAAARQLRGGNGEQEVLQVDLLLTRYGEWGEDPFFQELFQFAKLEFIQEGCNLGEVYNLTDVIALTEPATHTTKMVPYRSSKQLSGRRGEWQMSSIERKKNTGLLIFGKCPGEIIPVLKRRYSCMVGIDRNPTDYQYDEVVCDGAGAAEKAMEYLISLGHRNISYIGDCTYESRYIGYYEALLRHKIPMSYQLVFQTGQTREEGYHVMQKILKQQERPTAIFCANDGTALGVLQALKEHKKRGYNPSVISIDNIQAAESNTPKLTTVAIPKQEMVHLAVQLLLDRKEQKHQEYVRVELPSRLIERESCRPV